MLAAMLTVADKVLALFMMMAVGVLCSRFHLVTARGGSQITNVLVYVVSPCLIISSFQESMDVMDLKKIGVAALFSLFSQLLSTGVGILLFRNREVRRQKILRFATIYSNCGFMGLPLVQAVLGDTGVVYASVYIAIFNVMMWTQGYIMMSGSCENLAKKLIYNPGIIGFVLGVFLLAVRFRIPETLESVMESFSALNSPLAMLVIGTYVAKVRPKEFFSDKDVYWVAFFRLLAIPSLLLAVSFWMPVDRLLLVTCTVLLSAPSGGMTVLFASMFGGDAKLSAKLVAVTTLLSILTMPIFAVAAQNL